MLEPIKRPRDGLCPSCGKRLATGRYIPIDKAARKQLKMDICEHDRLGWPHGEATVYRLKKKLGAWRAKPL